MVYNSYMQLFAPFVVIALRRVAPVYKKRNLSNLQRWQIEMYIKKTTKKFF